MDMDLKSVGPVSMAFVWQHVKRDTSTAVLVTSSVILVLVEIFVLFVHRSSLKRWVWRRKYALSRSLYSTILQTLSVPVLVSCFLLCSVAFPNTAALFLMLGKLTYVLGSYSTVQYCLKQSGASVVLFSVFKLGSAKHRDMQERRDLHNRLSLYLSLVTQEIFVHLLTSLILQLLLYNETLHYYPAPVYKHIPLIIYHTLQLLSWFLAVIGYREIVLEARRQTKQSGIFLWYPLILQSLQGLAAIIEISGTLTVANINENSFAESITRSLVISGFCVILVNFLALCIMVRCTKSNLCKTEKTNITAAELARLPLSAREYENYQRNCHNQGTVPGPYDTGQETSYAEIQPDQRLFISLNKDDSRELLMSLIGSALPGQSLLETRDLEEGIRLLVSGPARKTSNSISSVATC